MTIYTELDTMSEHKTQFDSKGKTEHIAMVNIPNLVYPNQHAHIEIQHGSRDHLTVLDTVKITYNLDIESTPKTRRIVNKIRRILVKKRS